MRSLIQQYQQWRNKIRHRQSQPPVGQTLLLATEIGFKYGEMRFLWTDLSKVRIYLVDQFTYDRIEISLLLDSREVTITEGDVGFEKFINELQLAFPEVAEPLGFLSTHAFSNQVYEIDLQKL